ncbi:MAG: M3 family oligoendopeptidase [Nanoarchaeota archaeon]
MNEEINMSKTEWDLEILKTKGDEQFDNYWNKLERSYQEFIKKWKERKDYLEKPEVLKEALDEYELLLQEYASGGRITYYYALRNQQDQNDIEIKAKLAKIEDKATKLGNEIQFFSLNIAKIPIESQKSFLTSKSLTDYKHFLEKSFSESAHLLTEPEEKIMNLKASTSHSKWVEMVERLISKEVRKIIIDKEEVEKNFWELVSLTSDTKKEVRDQAAKYVNEIIVKVYDVAEEEINAILTDKKVDDELRKFSRPDQARHLGDDLDTRVVDSLVRAVTKNFDIPKKFYELKAKLLGQKKLAYHERNVPYGKIEKKYSYEESVRLVHEVLNNLDQEFGEIFKGFVQGGNIDVKPRKGKSGGAFCIHFGKNLPTYILLNHTERLQDVLTIAHETGHGINNELIKRKQNSINFGTPVSTAECASTFMEDFVLQKLMNDADDELKLTLMIMKLGDDVSTIFRQIACYNFESELHKEVRDKGFLSKEDIGKIFQKHMSAYMGPAVEQDPGSENWWVYWSHIRRMFYVYSYSSGLLISKSMQNKVKNDKKFVEKVKEFLSAGEADSPKNIFLKMGIDISDENFWEEGIKEVRTLLVETEELAKKLGKTK